MSPARWWATVALDLRQTMQRPLYWVWLVILALTAFGLSSGNMTISSGDSTVGGQKAWITSEFANGQMLPLVVFLFYIFFIAIAAGLSIIRDQELGVGEVIHATPLTTGEYVWGKFTAGLLSFVGVLAAHVVFAILCNHVLPDAAAADVRGPFALGNYLRPAAVMALPTIVFLAGVSFALGEWTRRPILVFLFPLIVLLVSVFFLWDWSPTWLDPRINRALMLLDVSGFRWINETWLKVDRGVEFYNHASIVFDGPFLASRAAYTVLGICTVAWAERRFARNLRGVTTVARGQRIALLWAEREVPADEAAPRHRPLADLHMTTAAPGLLRGIRDVAVFELRGLRSQPGMYLFIPVILLQTIGQAMVAVGPFGMRLLNTSGTLAVHAMNSLSAMVCLLLLFYTVESLIRERNVGLSPIYDATPVSTVAMLSGKAIANSVVGVIVVLATLVACLIVLLIQGTVPVDLRPFGLVWGLLLVPTFLLWSSFVMALFALTGNRYTSYALGLAALAVTGWCQATGHMTWVGNWDLWSTLRWSDMGTFDLNASALLLNRLVALGLTVFFVALTVRVFPRRDRDTVALVRRLRPGSLLRTTVRLLPYAVVPFVLGGVLYDRVENGFQGDVAKKAAKDYWRRNVATFRDSPVPAIARADVRLRLDPPRRHLAVEGTFDLVNHREQVLRRIPVTGGLHWKNVHWTRDGQDYEPEDRRHLYVFEPEQPLQPGDHMEIGFAFDGIFAEGITSNGGGTSEFILPSAVVLTSFSPSFVPVIGYDKDVGIDDDNRFDPRDYEDDWYRGINYSGFGGGLAYPVHIEISGPADYAYNSVGTCVRDTVVAGLRTEVWETEHPVKFFNVIAGKWDVRRGEGTLLCYHRGHTYNVDEMMLALDGARRYYSEWFMPYPWKQLKVSEFPNLATYAQGFPTNISFSEGIGFLTKEDPRSNPPFLVTAHEAAHQWWGNILTPGEGPGSDTLSEGMAHFSTLLLMEQVKGLRSRIEFAKRIEEMYGDDRQVDSELPMVRVTGYAAGDNTVIYNKGGWVFWMLLNRMGRSAGLAGYQEFIRRWSTGPDHPVLYDFIETMRPFAPDVAAYDDFVDQWFLDVVVPEYRLRDAERTRISSGEDPAQWEVTVTVENRGTGRMPVDVAASRGERFEDVPDAGASPAAEERAPGANSPDYREVRTTVELGAGESTEVRMVCGFEPERIVVDPDALVLQLEREVAVHRF